MSHRQGPRRECLFTIAHLRGLYPAGPCEGADLEPGWALGQSSLWWHPRCHPSRQVPRLTRFPVSPLILCPWGLGRGAAVDVENWVLGQSLLPHPLWGTEAAPQKAALASARPQMAVQK